MSAGLHVLLFRNAMEKASWLDNQASLDAATPIIRDAARLLASDVRPRAVVDELAARFATKVRATEPEIAPAAVASRLELVPHGPTLQTTSDGIIAERLQRWVRDAIAYVRDWRGREEFADTRSIVRRGYDDCDGKSRSFVALVRALYLPGFKARIRPVFNHAREFVHVQAEVAFPGSLQDSRSFDGGWLLAEMIVAGVELGDDPTKAGRKDSGGQYVMAGPNPAGILTDDREHA